jgi:hypothetical protein
MSLTSFYSFQDFWNEIRTYRRRDTAHLFSGTDFEESYVGAALPGAVCDLERAYGINWMTYSIELPIQVLLFAHDLGHNAGTPHFGEGEDTGHIMNTRLYGGQKGF